MIAEKTKQKLLIYFIYIVVIYFIWNQALIINIIVL